MISHPCSADEVHMQRPGGDASEKLELDEVYRLVFDTLHVSQISDVYSSQRVHISIIPCPGHQREAGKENPLKARP